MKDRLNILLIVETVYQQREGWNKKLRKFPITFSIAYTITLSIMNKNVESWNANIQFFSLWKNTFFFSLISLLFKYSNCKCEEIGSQNTRQLQSEPRIFHLQSGLNQQYITSLPLKAIAYDQGLLYKHSLPSDLINAIYNYMSTLDLSKVFGPSATKIHRRKILGRVDNLTKKKRRRRIHIF